MAMDTKYKSGVDYLPRFNWTPGMNDDLRYADSAGYCTSVEMVTSGHAAEWTDFGSIEVGNAYDMDPMDEMRTTISFPEGHALGMIGMAATESAPMQGGSEPLIGGKSANMSSPQNYNRIAISKKGE